jgi:hypothetical protein
MPPAVVHFDADPVAVEQAVQGALQGSLGDLGGAYLALGCELGGGVGRAGVGADVDPARQELVEERQEYFFCFALGGDFFGGIDPLAREVPASPPRHHLRWAARR